MPAAASGGVQPLRVQVIITTTGAKSAANTMQQVSGSTKKMSQSMQAGIISTRTLGDAMRMTASLMKYTVAGAFMKMGKDATQAFRNFELSFSRIRGLVGLGTDAVEQMQEQVLKMATETTRGPEELADALYYVTSAGIKNATVAMSVLERSAKAAAAGLGETNTVADAVTSTMNAYGLENMSAARATDVLVATVREGKAEADTFAPALGKVLPVAAAFGASFEDVSAAVAALSRSGMTAGTAAIYVRQTLSQLLKPSKQAQEALYAVGTSAEQIRENVQQKGLFEALQILSTQLNGVEEGAADFAKVFGNVRALTAVLSLVGPAAEENQIIFERLRNSTGDLNNAFGQYTDTVDAEFNRSFAAQRVALIELGKGLKPIVTDLLKLGRVASNVLKNIATFDGGGLVRMVAVLAVSVTAMAAALKTGSALIRLFSNLAITLSGGTLKWDALQKKIVQTNVATQANTANNAANAASSTVAAAGTTAFAGALTRLGVAITFVQRSLGILSIVLAVASAGFMMWQMRSKKSTDESDNLAESLSKVNDVLDETAKYGKIGIEFDIGTGVSEAGEQTVIDRLEKQIEEQSPQLFENISNVFNEAGQESGKQYIAGLMTTMFGGVTEETRQALIGVFARRLAISPKDLSDVMIPELSGDEVVDAAVNNALIFTKAQSDAFKNIGSLGELSDVLQKQLSFRDSARFGKGLRQGIELFGSAFQEDLKRTGGNVIPVLATIDELNGRFANTAVTGKIFANAFKNAGEEIALQGLETEDLSKIILDNRNQISLRKIVMASSNATEQEAADTVDKLRRDVEALDPSVRDNITVFNAFKTVLGPLVDEVEKTGDAASQASNDFDQLVTSVRASEEAYDEASNALKRYESAQEAMMGMSRDIKEAELDYADQLQSTADAVFESGGSFDTSTEKGRKATEELLKQSDAVFALANAYAKAGRNKEAGMIFEQGMQGLVQAVGKAGGAGAAEAATEILAQMGATSETFTKSVLAASDATGNAALQLGQDITSGIAVGISNNQATMSAALIAALNNVITAGKTAIDSGSPSKETMRELGIPMAQGVGVGFKKELKKQSGGMAKDLNTAVSKMYTGRYDQKAVQKFFKDFLERKKNVETPAQDFVKATIGRMKEIIGSLGNYIKSQLNFRQSQANLVKLINTQRKYDDDRKKAAREVQYAETRRGRMGGAEVTGYEQAQIDELQIEFERVSRDYAMGRATYVELVDAEIALFEARAAANEISDEIIDSQNNFIDKTVTLENKNLELADATVEVLAAYQDVQEAAYELYINHKELGGVYNSLATATGIASGKIVIGSKDMTTLGDDVGKLGGFTSTVGGYVSTLGNNVGITGQSFTENFYGEQGIFKTLEKTGSDVNTLTKAIGADFTDMSAGLLNTDSEMYRNLKSLGPAVFNAIQTAANEQFATSPLNLKIPVNVTVSVKGGSASVSVGDIVKSALTTTTTTTPTTTPSKGGGGSIVTKRAVGGPVITNTPYMVGERGPEMFVPSVSGTIVTNSALERYTRTRPSKADMQQNGPANNIVVTVNNPIPAAAEDSITRRMKVLANSGLFG